MVNSAAKPMEGVARGVRLRIGTWEGTVDFSVVPMDDFQVVLGMSFFDKVKAVPIPFLRSMALLEEKAPCMVPTTTKDGMPTLSAMQVEKGVKIGDLPLPCGFERGIPHFT